VRYESTPIKLRGATARAMAQVFDRRQKGQDVAGRIPCTWCKGQVSFTVFPSGMSRGACDSRCGVSWVQ
jgi:hypothetical protein